MRKDVAHTGNFREKFRDTVACEYKTSTLEAFYEHRRKCKMCTKYALEIGEFIRCPYCEFSSSNLTRHLKEKHDLNNKQVKERNIETISPNLRCRISKRVSGAIMNSPEERKRRSVLLGKLNKTEQFRLKASKTAKITSSRKDIQLKRAENLRKWREENPERFRKECCEKMRTSIKKWKKSKPEIYMERWLQEKYPNKFEWGKILRSNKFRENAKSDRKQIDFRSKDKNIFIEIDGPFHFNNLSREKNIESEIISEAINKTKKRDTICEAIIREREKLLLRIGYGCWNNASGKIREEVLDKVSNILENETKGIFKIGEIYGENNCL